MKMCILFFFALFNSFFNSKKCGSENDAIITKKISKLRQFSLNRLSFCFIGTNSLFHNCMIRLRKPYVFKQNNEPINIINCDQKLIPQIEIIQKKCYFVNTPLNAIPNPVCKSIRYRCVHNCRKGYVYSLNMFGFVKNLTFIPSVCDSLKNTGQRINEKCIPLICTANEFENISKKIDFENLNENACKSLRIAGECLIYLKNKFYFDMNGLKTEKIAKQCDGAIINYSVKKRICVVRIKGNIDCIKSYKTDCFVKDLKLNINGNCKLKLKKSCEIQNAFNNIITCPLNVNEQKTIEINKKSYKENMRFCDKIPEWKNYIFEKCFQNTKIGKFCEFECEIGYQFENGTKRGRAYCFLIENVPKFLLYSICEPIKNKIKE